MLDTHQTINLDQVDVSVVNGFVLNGKGGNPAGVVLNADDLSEADMQRIARRVGLSETAFVSRSKVADFRFDFFTPNRRIPHCGHATIAAFSHMAEIGIVGDGETSKETVDGVRKILIEDGAAYMDQLAPTYVHAGDWRGKDISSTDVLASLRLEPGQLDQRFEPVVVNTGNAFMLVAVADRDVLASIEPRLDQVQGISNQLDLVGYYVFTTDTGTPGRDATARMFAPRYAIAEEAATGMAAGPLACLLFDRLEMQKQSYAIEQGVYMVPPSPSSLDARLRIENGRIKSLSVGGSGKAMDRQIVELRAN